MKTFVIFIASLFALANGNNEADLKLPAPPLFLDVAPFQRQPFVSPDEEAYLDVYKRFKREGEEADERTSVVKVPNAVERFQKFLNDCKEQCSSTMGFSPSQIEKSLLFEEKPTPKEKCLMACVLQRAKIMTENNKVSVDTIGRLAGMISDNNELIIAIAQATAHNCNRELDRLNKCEAAFKINRCIADGLKSYKIKISY